MSSNFCKHYIILFPFHCKPCHVYPLPCCFSHFEYHLILFLFYNWLILNISFRRIFPSSTSSYNFLFYMNICWFWICIIPIQHVTCIMPDVGGFSLVFTRCFLFLLILSVFVFTTNDLGCSVFLLLWLVPMSCLIYVLLLCHLLLFLATVQYTCHSTVSGHFSCLQVFLEHFLKGAHNHCALCVFLWEITLAKTAITRVLYRFEGAHNQIDLLSLVLKCSWRI